MEALDLTAVLDSMEVQVIMEAQAIMEALDSTEAQDITEALVSMEAQAIMEVLDLMAVQVTEEALVFSRNFVLESNETQSLCRRIENKVKMSDKSS